MPAAKLYLVAFQPLVTDTDDRAADQKTLEGAVLSSDGIKVRKGEYLVPGAGLEDIAAASAHCRGLPRTGSHEGTIADRRGDRLVVEEVTRRGSIAVHADDPQAVLAWLSGHLGPDAD